MRDIFEQLGTDILDRDIARPLVLLGHSFAGFLAYETAAFLGSKGAQVDAVVLLDTAVPWRFRLDAPLQRVAIAAKNARDKWRGDLPTGDNVLSEPGYWRVDLSELPESLQNTLRAWYHAMISYRPSRSEIPILLFSAKTRRRKGALAGRNLGWRRFTSGPIRKVWLGDDHLSLIRDPATAGQAAREISDLLMQLKSGVLDG